MSLKIRPITREDYDRVVEIDNSNRSIPGTVEEMEYWINQWPADRPVIRVVAELDGLVVGSASAMVAPWMPAGDIGCGVIVDLHYRKRGIGAALYDTLQPFLNEQKPKNLRTGVKDNQPESLAFAEKRGFRKKHHIFDSAMNPTTFDETPFAGKIEESLEKGYKYIHFDTIQTLETEKKLHEFSNELLKDVPDAADRGQTSFEDFRKWAFDGPNAWPEAYVILVDKDGNWAGLTTMMKASDPKRCGIAFTAVSRDHRGHGLSLAIKLYGIRFLRERGVTTLVTNNHSANQRMLATNRKLGYIPEPGTFFVVKPTN